MTVAIIVGLGLGVGVSLVLAGMRPAPVALSRALAEIDRRPSRVLPLDGPGLRRGALARLLSESLAATTLGERVTNQLAADLRITETTAAEHLAARAALAITGLVWAPTTVALMRLGGVDLSFGLPIWLSVALMPVGFLYPGLAVRGRAADRRRAFRHALSAFLDVVSISLAGGRGVESALHDAAASGQGWAFDAIRNSLLEAQLLGETPWAGIARLGVELDVPELGELAASASLAGSEGARVRASLAAKARSLRLRGLTEIEAAAQAASERMSLPIVALMLGFIVFIAYPAVDKVVSGV